MRTFCLRSTVRRKDTMHCLSPHPMARLLQFIPVSMTGKWRPKSPVKSTCADRSWGQRHSLFTHRVFLMSDLRRDACIDTSRSSDRPPKPCTPAAGTLMPKVGIQVASSCFAFRPGLRKVGNAPALAEDTPGPQAAMPCSALSLASPALPR